MSLARISLTLFPLLDYTLCSYRAVVDKLQFVVQQLLVCVRRSHVDHFPLDIYRDKFEKLSLLTKLDLFS